LAKDKTKTLGERNYEEFAERYARVAETKVHNAHYDRPNTLSMLPDVADRRVLDAGCGPGFYAEELIARGADLVAFDVTPAFVEMTRRRIGTSGRVLQADLTQPLEFAQDHEFDLVLCPLVLDYIADLGAVFGEFRRVLKAEGILLFSVGHPFADWVLLQERLPEEARSYFETQLFSLAWGGFGEPKPVITSYRRPLAAFLNPLADAGFALEHLLEPQPTESMRELQPRAYEKLNRDPGFMIVRARVDR
jgi:2-polyprenyl-6-hydroxyphenyl methylase/3-demethylubiquinone-9 3-methyltransferase